MDLVKVEAVKYGSARVADAMIYTFEYCCIQDSSSLEGRGVIYCPKV